MADTTNTNIIQLTTGGEITPPASGEAQWYRLGPSAIVNFMFDVSTAIFSSNGNHLVITIENADGSTSTIVFEDYLLNQVEDTFPTFIMEGGEAIPGDVYLFAFNDLNEDLDSELETAAGNSSTGSGAGAYVDDEGNLFRSLDRILAQSDEDFDDGVSFSTGTRSDTSTNTTAVSANPPTFVGELSLTGDEDTSITIHDTDIIALVQDIDPNSYISVLDVSVEGGTLVSAGQGVWVFTPEPDSNGPYTVEYTVTDGTFTVEGGGTINVTPVNDLPVFTDDSTFTGSVTETNDLVATGTIQVTDADTEDTPEFDQTSYEGEYGTLTIDTETNTWTYTLDADAEPPLDGSAVETFNITGTSGDDTFAHEISVDVTGINDAPTATAESVMGEEGEIVTGQLDAGDLDGTTLTYTLTDADGTPLNANQIPDGFTIDADTGAWTFDGTDYEYAEGTYDLAEIYFTATDTDGGVSEPTKIDIDFEGVNDAPTATAESVMGEEGEIVTGQLDAGDLDGTTLTYTLTDADGTPLNANQIPDGFTIDADTGAWTFDGTDYEYAEGTYDLAEIYFTATDTDGGVSEPTKIDIDFEGVNDAPIATAESVVGEEGEIVTGHLDAGDLDGTTLTYTLTDADGTPLNANQIPDGFTIDADTGAWTFDGTDYEYAEGTYDLAEIYFTATDTDGGVSEPTKIDIDFEGVNDAPTATAESVMGEEGEIVTGQLDAGDLDGTTLTYTLTDADGTPLNANQIPDGFTIDADTGAWTFDGTDYEYAEGTYDLAEIYFTATDTDGGVSEPTKIDIDFEGVNDAPIATAESVVGEEGEIVTGQLDAGDLDGTTLTYTLTDADGTPLNANQIPDGFTIDADTGAWTFDGTDYEYAEGTYDLAEIYFTATDTDGGVSEPTKIDIDFEGVNDAPIATAESVVGEEGEIVTGQLDAGDLDGTTLTYTLTDADGTPLNANQIPDGFTIDADTGAWTFDGTDYEYAEGTYDLAEIYFTATDTDGGVSEPTKIDIDFEGVNDAPIATAESVVGEEGEIVTGQLDAGDLDGTTLTYTLTDADGTPLNANQIPDGFTIDADTGAWTFDGTDYEYAEGTYDLAEIYFTATDTDGGVSEPTKIDIDFEGVNDAPTATAESVMGEEGEIVTGQLDAGDLDGTTLTYTLTDADGTPLNANQIPDGFTIDADTGAWTFDGTDYEYAEGTYDLAEIYFTATDTDGGVSEPTKIDIDFEGVNDAPTATAESVMGEEGEIVTGQLDAGDLDGTTLTYTLTDADGTPLNANQIPDGFTIDADTGAWTFDGTDYEYAEGTYDLAEIYFTATDTDGGVSEPTKIDIDFEGVNDAPIATAESVMGEEGEIVTGQLDAGDLDGTTLTYTLTDADGTPLNANQIPDGFTIDADTGAWTFDGTDYEYAEGTYDLAEIYFTATDTDGGVSEPTKIDIDFEGVNDAPTATAESVMGEEGEIVTGQLDAGDLDGTTLTYTLTDADGTPLNANQIPDGFTIDADTGAWTFDGTDYEYAEGTYDLAEIYFTATDTDGGVSEPTKIDIDFEGVNDAPIATAESVMGEEGEIVTGQLDAGDLDGTTLTYTLTDADGTPLNANQIPDGFTIDADTGAWTFDGTDYEYAEGTYDLAEIYFTATDTDGGVSEPTKIDIDFEGVNDAPIATAESVVGEEGEIVTGQLDAGDLDGTTLTYTLTDADGTPLNANQIPDGFTIDADTGAWTFDGTDYEYAEGTYDLAEIYFTATDTDGGVSEPTKIDIDFEGVNDAPELSFNGADLSENFIFNGSFELAYAAGGGTEQIDSADGDWAQIAPAGWTKESSGRWEVLDGDRFNVPGATDGENVLDMSTTRAPLVISQEVSVDPGTYVIQLDAFDRGADRGQADSGVIRITWDGEGTENDVVYDIDPNDVDWTTGSVTITVPEGADSGTLTISSFGTNSSYANIIDNVRMFAVENTDNSVSVAENAPGGTFVADAIASDNDNADSDLTFSMAENDLFQINATTGEITVKDGADLNFESGTTSYTFDVSVSDGITTTTKALTINVTDVNEIPIAQNDTFTINEDTPTTFTTEALLDNDGDTDANDTAEIISVQDAQGGTAELVNGEITFTPTENYNGPASFTYTINDEGGMRDTATVKINVTAVNDAPTAEGLNATIDEGGTFSIAETDLINDYVTDIDTDADDLTITEVTIGGQPATLVDGNWTFTPPENFNGELTIEYSVSDQADLSNPVSATGTLTVTSINDAPEFTADSTFTGSVTETNDLVATGTIQVTDADTEDTPEYTKTSYEGEYGTLTIDTETNTWTYTLDADAEPPLDGSAVETFNITGTSGDDTFAHEISVDVAGINDAPEFTDDSTFTGSVTETNDLVATGTIQVTDADTEDTPEFDQTSYEGEYGTLTIDTETNTWTYTLDADAEPPLDGSAVETFNITGTSGDDTFAHEISVDVAGINDAPVFTDDSTFTGSVTETNDLVATGTIQVTDADTEDTPEFDQTSYEGEYGTLTIDTETNTWTYTLNADAEPPLDGSAVETFNITGTSGDDTFAHEISVDVAGINDAPVLDLDGGDGHLEVSFSGETASFNNIVGVYVVNDETGERSNPQILINNQNAGIPVGHVVGTLEAGTHYEYFIVANGESNYTDLANEQLSFGTNPTTGKLVLEIDGEASKSSVFFSELEQNPDNLDGGVTDNYAQDGTLAPGHFIISDPDPETGEYTIRIEDLWNGGDKDYYDVSLKVTPVESSDGTGYEATFIEDAGSVSIASASITITDVDSENMTDAVITLTNAQDGDELQLGQLPDTIKAETVTNEDGSITVTLTAADGTTASASDFESAIKSVSFYNTSENPSEVDRTIEVTVSDDHLATSQTATTTIEVVEVNDIPQITGESFTIDEGTSITLTFDELLANDTDVDGDLSISHITSPSNGTLDVDYDAQTVTFTPNDDFSGDASFKYNVTDGETTRTGTVDVTVNEVDATPVATDDEFGTVTVDPGYSFEADITGLNIDPSAVAETWEQAGIKVDVYKGQADHEPTWNNPSGNKLTLSTKDVDWDGGGADYSGFGIDYGKHDIDSGEIDGLKVGANTGDQSVSEVMVVSFGNDADNAGVDTVDLQLGALFDGNDGARYDVGFTESAQIAVYTYPENNGDHPTLLGTVTVYGTVDGLVDVHISASDFGDGSDLITHVALMPLENGADKDSPNNSDFLLKAVSASKAESISATYVEGEDITLNASDLLSNDTDADTAHASLSIDSVSDILDDNGNPVSGHVTLNDDNTITFHPNEGFSGEAQFTYTITDGTTTSEPATVTLNIQAVNDAPTLDLGDGQQVSGFAEDAGYTNMLGIYFVEDGIPSNPEIILTDSNNAEMLQNVLRTFEGDEDVHFFLIPDAGGQGVTQSEAQNLPLSFVKDHGNWALGMGTESPVEVRFDLSEFNPDNEPTFEFTVDGDTTYVGIDDQTSAISGDDNDFNDLTFTVTSVDDGTADYATGYTDGAQAVAIAGNVEISDADSTQISKATIVLTNAKSGDELNLPTLPEGMSAQTIQQANGAITLSLSGNLSLAAYQAVIKAVTFESNADDLDVTDRTIEITVFDDGGAASNTATTTISVMTGVGTNPTSPVNGDINGDDGMTPPDHTTGGLNWKDNVYAGDEDANTIWAHGGNDQIYGMAGNDTIHGQDHNDTLYGGTGDDSITGDQGNDVIHGGDGNDVIHGGDNNDLIYGGADNDLLTGINGDDTFYGGSGNDTVHGGDNNDNIYGGSGNDILNGDQGNDILHGGDGQDILNGGENNDILVGGDGNDLLVGGGGNDLFAVGVGDTVDAGNSDNYGNNDWGQDTIFIDESVLADSDGGTIVIENFNLGSDVLEVDDDLHLSPTDIDITGDGDTILTFSNETDGGNDVIVKLLGVSKADFIQTDSLHLDHDTGHDAIIQNIIDSAKNTEG